MVRVPSAGNCDINAVFGSELDAVRNVCFVRDIHYVVLGMQSDQTLELAKRRGTDRLLDVDLIPPQYTRFILLLCRLALDNNMTLDGIFERLDILFGELRAIAALACSVGIHVR